MGRAIFMPLSFLRKPCKFIDIPFSGSTMLSHALRRCFIAAKSERPQTVCVSVHTTKRGG
jgi:hypothetical protein